MKICFIHNLYFPYAKGGAENVIKRVIDSALEKKIQCSVICSGPVEKIEVVEGVKVYYLKSDYYNLHSKPLVSRLVWHFFQAFNWEIYFKVRKILAKEKPKLVVTNNLIGLSFLIWRAAAKSGAKVMHVLHDVQLLYPSGLIFFGRENVVDSWLAKGWQLMTSRMNKYIDYIASPSQWLLTWHLERGFFKKAKSAIIKNPVELNQPVKVSKTDDKFSLVFVGQLEEHKGVKVLVEAFKILEANKPGRFKLIIVGGGSLFETMSELSAGYDIELKGKRTPAEVSATMAGAGAVIVPSTCYENAPLVILEAAANQVPVIGSRLGGIAEMLPAESLFKPGDASDLAKKISRLEQREIKCLVKIELRTGDDYLEDLLTLVEEDLSS